MKAFLKNYRQSPRKVRLVADLIKGKSVEVALVELSMLPKRAATPLLGLLKSAIANAKAMGIEIGDLKVKDFKVDKGIVMKRFMPRAMGRASRINKRTSHVSILLAPKFMKLPKAKKAEAVSKPKPKVVKAIKKTKKVNSTNE